MCRAVHMPNVAVCKHSNDRTRGCILQASSRCDDSVTTKSNQEGLKQACQMHLHQHSRVLHLLPKNSVTPNRQLFQPAAAAPAHTRQTTHAADSQAQGQTQKLVCSNRNAGCFTTPSDLHVIKLMEPSEPKGDHTTWPKDCHTQHCTTTRPRMRAKHKQLHIKHLLQRNCSHRCHACPTCNASTLLFKKLQN